MAGAGSLASLVVRLVGDGTSFTRMLDKAEADTRSSAETIERAGSDATSAAADALDDYGDEARRAGSATDKFAGEVSLSKTALAGQQIRVNSAGKAIDKYGRFVKSARMDLKKLGGTMKSVGGKMTIGITLPLLGAAAAAVKLASDAEETESKMEQTFRGITAAARAAAADLANNYNFANTESKALLAGTGDLLTGFGFTAAGALEMSHEINKLAADLASFQNLEGGAARASDALTKGLMGERESMKALGIAINEEDVKKQVALNTANGLIHATERQAKAYATLQLAQEASKNAIGDVARTSESFANQSRALVNDLKDVAEVIGADLLPIAAKLLDWTRKLIGKFSGLSATQRKIAIGFAAVAAAMGPVIFMAGLVASAVGAYTLAATTAGLTTKAFTAAIWSNVKALVAQAAKAALAAGKMLLTPAAMLLVAVAAYKLGQMLNNLFGNTGIEDFNREMERSRKLSGKIADRHTKAHQAVMKQAGAIKNAGDKEAFLRKELERAKKEQEGNVAAVRAQKKVVGELNTSWKSMTGNKILEGERESLKEAETALDAAKGRTQELQDALDATGATAKGAADKIATLGLEADNLNEKFKAEIDMFGKSGREAEIYALKLKGATDEQLAAATATAATLKAMEDDKAARDAAKSVTDGLEKQRATFGMTAAEITQYEMKLAGATTAERAHAAAVTADIEAMQQAQSIDDFNAKLEEQIATFGMTSTEAEIYKLKLAGATEAQVASMRANADRLKGMQDEQKLLAKGKSLTEQYMKPQEKLAKAEAELNKLLAQGAIDQHTYDAALKDATKSMKGAEDQAGEDYKVDLKVAGVDAVEAGTAEAAARMREYLALRDEGEEAPDTPEGQLAEQVSGLQDEIQHTIDMTWPEQAMQRLGDSLDAFGLGGVRDTLDNAFNAVADAVQGTPNEQGQRTTPATPPAVGFLTTTPPAAPAAPAAPVESFLAGVQDVIAARQQAAADAAAALATELQALPAATQAALVAAAAEQPHANLGIEAVVSAAAPALPADAAAAAAPAAPALPAAAALPADAAAAALPAAAAAAAPAAVVTVTTDATAATRTLTTAITALTETQRATLTAAAAGTDHTDQSVVAAIQAMAVPVAPVATPVATQTTTAAQTTGEHEGRVETLLGRIATATEASTELTGAGL